MSAVLIRCRNVVFAYPHHPALIDGFNADFKAQTITALMGPNGSGKTTLLKLLSGLIIPLRGDINIGDASTVTEWGKIRKNIGVSMYAERSFNFRLTGQQNAEYIAALSGYSRRDAQSRIKYIADMFEAKSIFDLRFSELSLGQRRIFSLFMALLSSGNVILVDEPTATLDAHNRQAVCNMLCSMRENGYTVVVTTHDEQVGKLADTTIYAKEFIS